MTRATSERSFGISVGTVCLLIAGYVFWRGHLAAAQGVGWLGVVLLSAGTLKPSLLRVPSALWWRLTHAIGWINIRLVLSAIFVLMFTPMGLALRFTGWDPMRRRHDRTQSGWIPYPQRHGDPKHYERMYCGWG